jgi:hypothetical protein
MSKQDLQLEWAEDHPWTPEAVDPEPEPAEPIYTVGEAEAALKLWKRYVAQRPTSKLGPGEVAYWERVLTEAKEKVKS